MTEDQLFNKIINTTHAPRGLLIRYIQSRCARARGIPLDELVKKSGNDQYRDPVTIGEKIAGDIHHVLVQQEYVNWSEDPELADIMGLAYGLTDRTEDEKSWEELFKKVSDLGA